MTIPVKINTKQLRNSSVKSLIIILLYLVTWPRPPPKFRKGTVLSSEISLTLKMIKRKGEIVLRKSCMHVPCTTFLYTGTRIMRRNLHNYVKRRWYNITRSAMCGVISEMSNLRKRQLPLPHKHDNPLSTIPLLHSFIHDFPHGDTLNTSHST